MKPGPLLRDWCTERSPPARGRELKHNDGVGVCHQFPSPPARGRELKPAVSTQPRVCPSSPPARGRELKLESIRQGTGVCPVAPRAGA